MIKSPNYTDIPAPNSLKRRVYLNEFNVLFDGMTYLPLVTGLLRAYAETRPSVRENYEFQPFLFHVDRPEEIIDQYQDPDVAAFSVSMWNEQLNLTIAQQVKERWPNCLIVFGGAQVPHNPTDYFEKHPFIDVAVRGEGEESFAEIMEQRLVGNTYADMPGVSWRDPSTGKCVYGDQERPFNRDLDVYPSPYLDGLYDELMAGHPELEFQAIIETNRGCPFLCTFCYWGKGGLSRKYRHHSMERVTGELEWCAQNKIKYVFNADSNFGMHKRDMDIAHLLVDLKKKYGYPEKFRTCYGKNTNERIFEIGSLFHEHALEKGITLSRQSFSELTLKNIKRDNIKLEVYTNLQKSFNDRNVPVYCELILGLPGETRETWIEGIEKLLQTGLQNQIFIYLCQMFNNTELADPAYIEKHGLITRDIKLEAIHSAIPKPGWVREIETTVVATNTMSVDEWRRMALLSWTTMLIHSLKSGFFVMGYLTDRFKLLYADFLLYLSELQMRPNQGGMWRAAIAHFNRTLDSILSCNARSAQAEEYGDILWEPEEMPLLELTKDVDTFYAEFEEIVLQYLDDRQLDFNADEVREAVLYQKLMVPTRHLPAENAASFNYNFPEYFAKRLGKSPVALEKSAQVLTVSQEDYEGNSAKYAKSVILWGRKSGLLLRSAEWQSSAGGEHGLTAAG